ncbi:MAG TPA: cytochrome d ubiquinol oxidase subunit II [Gemmatimonadaceae bacterium]|jgi:cytochrome d ubiquinol oxidase subunit II
MSSFFTSIGLPEIIAGLMVVALNAYALTGGADFGGGVWDLLATGPGRHEQREHISESIAPIWEANHVWLIVVVVVMFTAFPAAFQQIVIVLHIPLTIMLVGVVLRGSAFVFRSYGARTQQQRERWGAIFAVASVITPILLGISIGALATGEVGEAARRIDAGAIPFVEGFISPWFGIFPIATGLFALALFAFVAAVYLAHGSKTDDLREVFRRRALSAAIAVFVLAAIALVAAYREAPHVAHGVAGSAWALPLHVLTGIAAVGAIMALVKRSYGLARIAAAAQVTFILWGWVLSQYPYIVPDTSTIRDSAAPPETLTLLLIGLTGGTLILAPALRYLYGIFTVKPPIARRGTRAERRRKAKS